MSVALIPMAVAAFQQFEAIVLLLFSSVNLVLFFPVDNDHLWAGRLLTLFPSSHIRSCRKFGVPRLQSARRGVPEVVWTKLISKLAILARIFWRDRKGAASAVFSVFSLFGLGVAQLSGALDLYDKTLGIF
ncbi:MAG: hypothetical protein K2X41_05125 [Hyphomicrobium sp.]|nr:hypothetical protein [Hyphomicrobium sp.]